MRYSLSKLVIGDVPEIEISAEEYSDYQKARKILSNALAIEEKYEIVVTNYLDFEKQLLETIVSDMVRERFDYLDSFELRLAFNIRLANLLTGVRLYVDQLGQNVRDCVPGDANAEEKVKQLFTKEYDENKEYRFMEALRNYVQHRGLPVHQIQRDGRWTSLQDDGLLEFSMELLSQRSYLEEDPKFKKRVLAELDEKIDLKAATRSYVESISNVHEAIRSLITESVTSARELIEQAHRLYASVHSESLVGLSACAWKDDRVVSSIPLFLEWDNVRVKLQKRNKKLANLRKCYVTGHIKNQTE